MKKLFQKRKKVIIGAISLFVALVALYIVLPSNTDELKRAYTAYELVASNHDTAAYFPSIIENDVRKELNRILSQVLIGDISAEERLSLAQQGTELLEVAEGQIDQMGTLVPVVAHEITGIEDASGVFDGMGTDEVKEELVTLARHRIEIISDIRGLSYRANYHTAGIFEQIIKDGGELTDHHTTLLNKQIPLIEEQFDRRSNLYTELQSTRAKIEGIMAQL